MSQFDFSYLDNIPQTDQSKSEMQTDALDAFLSRPKPVAQGPGKDLSTYLGEAPFRRAGASVGRATGKMVAERAPINYFIRQSGDVGELMAESMGDDFFDRMGMGVVRGLGNMASSVTDIAAEPIGWFSEDTGEKLNQAAAIMRGFYSNLRPEDEAPTDLVRYLESSAESLPMTAVGLGGAGLGAVVGGPGGARVGGAVGGFAGAFAGTFSMNKYEAEMMADQVIASAKAGGWDVPDSLTDGEITRFAATMSAIEGGVEGLSNLVTLGIGSMAAKRLGKRITKDMTRKALSKYLTAAGARAVVPVGALAGSSLVEGLEEVITEIAQNQAVERGIAPAIDPTAKREMHLMDAFLGGMVGGTVTGGGMAGIGAAAQTVQQSVKRMKDTRGYHEFMSQGVVQNADTQMFVGMDSESLQLRIDMMRDVEAALDENINDAKESRRRADADGNVEEVTVQNRKIDNFRRLQSRNSNRLEAAQKVKEDQDGGTRTEMVPVRDAVDVARTKGDVVGRGQGTKAVEKARDHLEKKFGVDVVVIDAPDNAGGSAQFDPATPTTVYLFQQGPKDDRAEGYITDGIHEALHILDHFAPEAAAEVREIVGGGDIIARAEAYLGRGTGQQEVTAAKDRREQAETEYRDEPTDENREAFLQADRDLEAARNRDQEEASARGAVRAARTGETDLTRGELREGLGLVNLEGPAEAITQGGEQLQVGATRLHRAIDRVAARLGLLGREAKAAQRVADRIKNVVDGLSVAPGDTVEVKGLGAERQQRQSRSARKPLPLQSRRVTDKAQARYRANLADADAGSLQSRRANETVREQARTYTQSQGIAYDEEVAGVYADVDVERAKRIADAFDTLPFNALEDQETKQAYTDLVTETIAQYEYLADQGVNFVPWASVGEPYANSTEMLDDVQNNQRLYYFKTVNPKDQETFGTDISDYDGETHPLLKTYGEPVPDAKGTLHQQVVNDLFRAVHDYFGHTKEGFQFGPKGEENAWRVHSLMYSPSARRAMTTETRGQNSWVNFNQSLRRKDGSVPVRGDEDFVPLQDRPFAEQKTALLPQEFVALDEEQAQPLQSRRSNQEVRDLLSVVERKSVREALAETDIVRYITEEEALGFSSGKYVKQSDEVFKEYTADEKLLSDALRIFPAAAEWYNLSEEVFSALGEGNIPLWKLVGVIATTSAQKSVEMNVQLGLRTAVAYQTYIDAGFDPNNTEQLLQAIAGKTASKGPTGRMKEILQAGTGPLYLYADVLGTGDVLQSQSMNEVVERLLAPGSMIKQHLDLSKGTGSARKLAAFLRNLLGDESRVTNDVWMAFWWGTDQQNFSSNVGYTSASAAMRRIAQSAGMAPSQGQASAWALSRVYLSRIRNEKKRSPENRRTFAEIIAEPVTIEDLLGTDIGTLLVMPTLNVGGKEVANESPELLRSLGFNPDAARRIVENFESRYREAYAGVDIVLPDRLGPRRAARLVRGFEQADIERNIGKNVKRRKEGKPDLPTTPLQSRRADSVPARVREGDMRSVLNRTINDMLEMPIGDRPKTAEQIRAALGQAGVEREEIYWSGTDDWLKSQNLEPGERADLNELAAFTEPTDISTSIQAPSFLTMKTSDGLQTRMYNQQGDVPYQEYLPQGSGTPINIIIDYGRPHNRDLAYTLTGNNDLERKRLQKVHSHEFLPAAEQGNTLVHVRATLQQYETADDTLHIAEVQSDWARHVRRHFSKIEVVPTQIKNSFPVGEDEIRGDVAARVLNAMQLPPTTNYIVRGARSKIRAAGEDATYTLESLTSLVMDNLVVEKIPVAPFVYSRKKGKVSAEWQKLALKRAVLLAVDEGKRFISLPNQALVNSVAGINVTGKLYETLPGIMRKILKRYDKDAGNPTVVPAGDLEFEVRSDGSVNDYHDAAQAYVDDNIDEYAETSFTSDAQDAYRHNTENADITLDRNLLSIVGFVEDNWESGPEMWNVKARSLAYDLMFAHNPHGFQAGAFAHGYAALLQRPEDRVGKPQEFLDKHTEMPDLRFYIRRTGRQQYFLDSGDASDAFGVYSPDGELLGEFRILSEAADHLAYLQIETLGEYNRSSPVQLNIHKPEVDGVITFFEENDITKDIADYAIVPEFNTSRRKPGGFMDHVYAVGQVAAYERFREAYVDWSMTDDASMEFVRDSLRETFYDNHSEEEWTSQGASSDSQATVYDIGLAEEEGTIANAIQAEAATIGMPLFSRRSGDRSDQVNTPSTNPISQMSRSEFNRNYSQHVDIRHRQDGKGKDRIRQTQESGGNPGFGMNVLPIYGGGKPRNVVDMQYAPQKGDIVYLVPNEQTRKRDGDPYAITEGYKPEAHEVLVVDRDFPDVYELAKQRDQVNTPEFQQFYEGNHPLTYNESGDPVVVYHGTQTDFDTFDPTMEDRNSASLVEGGMFFTDDFGEAGEYGRPDEGGMVKSFYLSLKNPYILDSDRKLDELERQENGKDFLVRNGHDGVIQAFPGTPTEFVVLDPRQIKSATDNVGTFNAERPSTLESRRGGLGDPRVNTPEFKDWFGGSKVANSDGTPKVQYHGTQAGEDFSAFRAPKDSDPVSNALFVAPRPWIAEQYAGGEEGTGKFPKNARLIPVYASIQNPYMLDSLSQGVTIGELRAEGYDGVVDAAGGYWAAFDPSQLKSALGNRGTFDPTQDSMLESRRTYRRDAEAEFMLGRERRSGAGPERRTFRAGYAYGAEEEQMLRQDERLAARERHMQKMNALRDKQRARVARIKAKFDDRMQLEKAKRLIDKDKNQDRVARTKAKYGRRIDAIKADQDYKSALRNQATIAVNALPKRLRGGFIGAIKNVKTDQALSRLAYRVDRHLAYASYSDTDALAKRATRMLNKRKMSNDTRKAVNSKLKAARDLLRPTGKKIRLGKSFAPGAPLAQDLISRASEAQELINSAVEAYMTERADFRTQKDARSERLLDAATQIENNVRGKRQSGKTRKDVAGAKRKESALRRLLRWGSDIDSMSRAVDESGVLHEYVSERMRAAESDYFSTRRETLEEMDQIAREAGFRDADDLLAATSDDTLGAGTTQLVEVQIDGERITIRLGEAMKLAALDDETHQMIANKYDEEGNRTNGVGIKFSEAEMGRTYYPDASDIDTIAEKLTSKQLEVVRGLKRFRESMRDAAFDVFFRLNGYQPRFVPGYEPRSRLATSRTKLDPTQAGVQGVAPQFADAGGFTKDRVESGGSPVLIGDFVTDFLRSSDALARMQHMAEPTRDAWSLLMDDQVAQAIAEKHGENAVERLRQMVVNGSGMNPAALGGVLGEMQGALAGAYITANPGTFIRVALGGISRMIADPDVPVTALLRATTNWLSGPSFDEIAERSGYFYSRNRESAIDRRANTQQVGLADERRRMARRHFAAAFRESSGMRIGEARKQIMLAFGQLGILDAIDRMLVRIAVQAHINDGKNLDQAVYAAEKTIRRTQNTTSPLDDASIMLAGTDAQRGVSKFMLTFSSDPLKAGARLHEAVATNDMQAVARWTASTLANATVNVVSRPSMYIVAGMIAELLGDEEDELLNEVKTARAYQPGEVTRGMVTETVSSAGMAGYLSAEILDLLMRSSAGESTYGRTGAPSALSLDALVELTSAISTMVSTSNDQTFNKAVDRGITKLLQVGIGDPTAPIRKILEGVHNRDLGQAEAAKRISWVTTPNSSSSTET